MTRLFLSSSGAENDARPPNHPFSPKLDKNPVYLTKSWQRLTYCMSYQTIANTAKTFFTPVGN